jgi:hypothetical protein
MLNFRQVTESVGNFKHISSIQDVIPCIQNLSNTQVVQLSYEQIQACDEPPVTCCRAPFIKKYHHFTYPRHGVVKCLYIKGQGSYNEELMKQVPEKGMYCNGDLFYCFIILVDLCCTLICFILLSFFFFFFFFFFFKENLKMRYF